MSTTPRDGVPHAFPFRLVERTGESEGVGHSVVLTSANGAVRPGEPWPVTLVAEALAQSILLLASPPQGAFLRLVALDAVRLLRPVEVGDRLEIEVEEAGVFGSLRRFSCRALCGGALAATAEVTVVG